MPSLMHRRRALKHLITYIGLDVHKETIAVALAEAGLRGDVREYGKIANTPAAVKALVAKLARNGHELRFCYEAGPCGYGIQRQLTALKHDCMVVAPSLIPRRPGERIKTDRRDAINLAKLHRAGELTPVWVPDEAHEAIRDLVRARLAAVRTLRQARQQLSGFLLRQGHHYNRPAWTLMHRRWLAGLRFEHAVRCVVTYGDFPWSVFRLSVRALQGAVGCACLAIAQTKPASSRAIAAVTTVGGFPARANLRYLRQSRSCAFHAMSRMGLVRPSCRSNCSRLIFAGNR